MSQIINHKILFKESILFHIFIILKDSYKFIQSIEIIRYQILIQINPIIIQHFILQKAKMPLHKIVDQYQFYQEHTTIQNDIEIIQAKHIRSKQYFTLKKIGLDQSYKYFHDRIINETDIIRYFTNKYSIKCYNMIKTSNNIYFVYDFMNQKNNLMNLNYGNKMFSNIDVLFKRLIDILVELQVNKIINLNLNIKNLQAIIQNKNYHFRINNFQFATRINNTKNQILSQYPQSEYLAPQIFQSSPIIGYHCDIYSIGKIIQYIKQHSQVSLDNKQRQIMQKMIIRDYRQRISLEQILKIMQTEKNQNLIEKYSFKQKINQFTIMGKRNLLFFLLKCSFLCSSLNLISIDLSIKLSFLFIKYANIIVQKLIQQIKDIKNLQKYEGFKATSKIFNTQTILQIVLLQQNLKQLSLSIKMEHNRYLLKQIDFNEQILKQEINHKYLSFQIYQFINGIINWRIINKIDKQCLNYILIMSFINDFNSFQHLFEQIFNQQLKTFQNQTLFLQIKEMQAFKIIQEIESRCRNVMKLIC